MLMQVARNYNDDLAFWRHLDMSILQENAKNLHLIMLNTFELIMDFEFHVEYC